MELERVDNQMSTHSFKIKTSAANEKSEMIHRSFLACNDASSILNLSYDSHEKIKSMISGLKEHLFGTYFACFDEDAEVCRNIWSTKY